MSDSGDSASVFSQAEKSDHKVRNRQTKKGKKRQKKAKKGKKSQKKPKKWQRNRPKQVRLQYCRMQGKYSVAVIGKTTKNCQKHHIIVL